MAEPLSPALEQEGEQLAAALKMASALPELELAVVLPEEEPLAAELELAAAMPEQEG
jgi:hypothetical protein